MRYRPTRRQLVIAGIVLATIAVLTVVGLWVVYPRLGAWMIERKVVPKLEAKLGRDVTIGSIDVDHGHAVLRDVRVRGPHDGSAPLVSIARIDVDFDFWASLTGDAKVGKVTIDGVSVRARRGPDGVDNFRDLLERFGIGGTDDPDAPAKKSGLGSIKPTKIELTSGEAVFVDEAAGMTATVLAMDATWARGAAAELHLHDARAATTIGPAASASEITAIDHPIAGRGVTVAGGEVSMWKGLSLTGITGSVAPEADRPQQLAVSFEGGYGGVDGKLWTASGWIDPSTAQGAIDLDAARFTLDRLRPILERSAVVDYDRASVDARLHVELAGAVAKFAGGFHLQDFTVDHPMLAEKPVHGLEVGGEIDGQFDRASRVLTLARADLSARGLPFHLDGWAALPGGLDADGARRAAAAFDVRFTIPPKPCQEVLDAIPPELVPYLQGFKLTGTFDTDLRVAVDYKDLQATVLTGHVGLLKCRGKKAPEDVRRLATQFEHYVEVERGNWISFVVGPDNPDFVPITDVSPNLIKSLMTTEDSSFYHHRGFITREFRSALVKNLEAGYFKYGASSITMQLVKNVLLYREKTLSRKLQELFLTWYIETFLEKDRILEIYVNVIEYGPGLYGIGPAAEHYFGKHPRDLNPVEAAFFSSILPSPKARYDQYCKGTLRKWTESKIQRILALMLKRQRLTQEEYDLAIATPLVFVRNPDETEDECMARRKKALKNARPTNPLKK